MASKLNVDGFLEGLTASADLAANDRVVGSLIRADLKVPAKGLGLTIKPNARKSEFYQEVVFALSEKGLVSESLVESLEDSSLSERSFAEESVEVMKIKLEMEREAAKLEMEREAARRQHELDMVDREAQASLTGSSGKGSRGRSK